MRSEAGALKARPEGGNTLPPPSLFACKEIKVSPDFERSFCCFFFQGKTSNKRPAHRFLRQRRAPSPGTELAPSGFQGRADPGVRARFPGRPLPLPAQGRVGGWVGLSGGAGGRTPTCPRFIPGPRP